jgi:hypothetical protein
MSFFHAINIKNNRMEGKKKEIILVTIGLDDIYRNKYLLKTDKKKLFFLPLNTSNEITPTLCFAQFVFFLFNEQPDAFFFFKINLMHQRFYDKNH